MLMCNTGRREMFGKLMLLAGLAGGCSSIPLDSDTRSEEAGVVDNFLDAYRSMNVERMFALLDENIYFEDPTFHLIARNHEEMRLIVEPAAVMWRNARIEPFNRVHASPWVISQQRLGGTLTLPNGGGERTFDVQGVSIFEVRGLKIVRWYDYYDVMTFRQQTGGTP
jgi:limonene-1,2-epoxide hydrolase